jgi:hypothetical protein
VTSLDRAPFVRALAELSAVLRWPITDGQVDAYWRALEDLPWPSVKAGLAACLRDCHAMPTPADVRAHAPQAEYHAIGSQAPGTIGRAACEVCAGTGWELVTVQTSGLSTRQARRCKCRLSA